MANHKATEKATRKNAKRSLHNKYYRKTARNAVRDILRKETDVTKAEQSAPKIVSLVDKLARKKMLHKNKAANIKRKIAKRLRTLKATPEVSPGA